MYSTCIFCSGALGRNESLEHFPVGRRLAFDAAKGRLWVVCPSCARWNLTPLEVRWEAIEEAERAFRDARLRTATEHIGLAKLREGTELVRIGRPMLPEFAAWRYGDVFRRRWKRVTAYSMAGAAVPLAYAGYTIFGLGTTMISGGFLSLGITAYNLLNSANLQWQSRRPRTAVVTKDGQRLLVSRHDAARSRLFLPSSSGEWELQLGHRQIVPTGMLLRGLGVTSRQRFDGYATMLRGDDARRALTALLPVVNHGGATSKDVARAVTIALDARTVPDLLAVRRPSNGMKSYGLATSQIGSMNGHVRLAMEMVTHEEDERRALEGELHQLEARWREAEEIAAIADGMFLPSDINERLDRLGGRAD